MEHLDARVTVVRVMCASCGTRGRQAQRHTGWEGMQMFGRLWVHVGGCFRIATGSGALLGVGLCIMIGYNKSAERDEGCPIIREGHTSQHTPGKCRALSQLSSCASLVNVTPYSVLCMSRRLSRSLMRMNMVVHLASST
jgi:hypothetical protein